MFWRDFSSLVLFQFWLFRFLYLVLRIMSPKRCGSKVPVRGSNSRSQNGGWDENMHVNPYIQPPNIPKASTKATIDGILFSAIPTKICRDSYTNVY